MKTIRGRIRQAFIILSVVIILLISIVFLWLSKVTITEITDNLLLSKLYGDINSAHLYMREQYGELSFEDGMLYDEQGNSIERNYEFVDAVLEDLDDAATVFSKQDDDFVRVVTNIKKEDGTRAIGTMLGKDSQAYLSVINGEEFIGEADILEKSYLTIYDPIIDDDGQVIGILFVGVSREQLLSDIIGSIIRQVLSVVCCGVVVFVLAIIYAGTVSKNITGPIRNSIRHLRNTATRVTNASKHLTEYSVKMSQSTSEQAAAIEETSATMDETSSMVELNAEHTKLANNFSKAALDTAEAGTCNMNEMTRSMDELKNSSNDIAKIIKLINDIAFQTNMLSLNAAVEAARAGDAGQGFSVVAEEVRNLAQKSATAAKDTAEIIDRNIELSEQGVVISKNVNSTLSEIVEKVEKVGGLVSEVNTASQEQAKGIHQVNVAINQIEEVIQIDAEVAYKTNEAAQDMQNQATELDNIIVMLDQMVEGSKKQKESESELSDISDNK